MPGEPAVVPRLADDGEDGERRDAHEREADPTKEDAARLRRVQRERPKHPRDASAISCRRRRLRPCRLLRSQPPAREREPAGGGRPHRGGCRRRGARASSPDPNLKTVSRAFEKIAQRHVFLGNVGGKDVTHDELTSLYDAVLRIGSQTDRRLGVLERIFRARGGHELVAWYNGHPDFQHPSSASPSSERSSSATDVALDVGADAGAHSRGARPHRHDRPRDRGDLVLEAARDRPRSARARAGVVDVGQLQEMGELSGVIVDEAELELDPASEAELADASNIVRRNVEILRTSPHGRPAGRIARFACASGLTGRDPR